MEGKICWTLTVDSRSRAEVSFLQGLKVNRVKNFVQRSQNNVEGSFFGEVGAYLLRCPRSFWMIERKLDPQCSEGPTKCCLGDYPRGLYRCPTKFSARRRRLRNEAQFGAHSGSVDQRLRSPSVRERGTNEIEQTSF